MIERGTAALFPSGRRFSWESFLLSQEAPKSWRRARKYKVLGMSLNLCYIMIFTSRFVLSHITYFLPPFSLCLSIYSPLHALTFLSSVFMFASLSLSLSLFPYLRSVASFLYPLTFPIDSLSLLYLPVPLPFSLTLSLSLSRYATFLSDSFSLSLSSCLSPSVSL